MYYTEVLMGSPKAKRLTPVQRKHRVKQHRPEKRRDGKTKCWDKIECSPDGPDTVKRQKEKARTSAGMAKLIDAQTEAESKQARNRNLAGTVKQMETQNKEELRKYQIQVVKFPNRAWLRRMVKMSKLRPI